MQWQKKAIVAALTLAGLVLASGAWAQFGPQFQPTPYPPTRPYRDPSVIDFLPSMIGFQIGAYVLAGFVGLVFGFLLSDRLKGFRRYVWLVILALYIPVSLIAPLPINLILSSFGGIVLFFVAAFFAFARGQTPPEDAMAGAESITFGSAKWATARMLQSRGLVGMAGLGLGYYRDQKNQLPLHYTGDRHLLTVAPTRAGKGVAAIIPNLLTYRGSALVIDPKGENAMTTALRRGPGNPGRGIEGMGQRVHVVDPWGLTTDVTGLAPACFNPLDWLDPSSLEAGENAMMLADALVVSTSGAGKDPFWDEEAKALLMGFILHVAVSPKEAHNRHLGRVRDILTLPVEAFNAVLVDMLDGDNPIVASSAARLAGKEEKLQASVISSAQSHTHFLDSPRLRDSLSRSDFSFEDLKRTATTVYLVLPADRLDTFGRWLRLLIQQAITVTARNIIDRPTRPILFMLDEMAALGRLAMVEQAYGLMAGFGMQLWGVVQDLSQLERIYGKGWQTFIGNSGVLQYFGSRDKMTADYFSDLCGMQTVKTLQSSISQAFSSGGQGGSTTNTTSHNHGETHRKLIMPDELMRVASHVQLLLVENLDPIASQKITWFQDSRFKPFGLNLRELRVLPEQHEPPEPPLEAQQAA